MCEENSDFVVDVTFEVQLTLLFTRKLVLLYKIVDATNGAQGNCHSVCKTNS